MAKKVPPRQVPPAAAPKQPSSQPPIQSAPSAEPSPAQPVPAETGSVPGAISDNAEKKAIVDTPLYYAEFSNRGAVLTSFRLKKFQDDFGKPLEMIPQISGAIRPLGFNFEDPEISKIAAGAIYKLDREQITLNGANAGELQFVYSGNGYYFRKYLKFRADTYILDCVVEAKRNNLPIPVRLTWGPGIENTQSYKKKDAVKPSRAIVNSGNEIERLDPPKDMSFTKIGSTVRWAGVENNYFVSAIIPIQSSDAYLNGVSTDKKAIHNVVVTVAELKQEPFQLRVFIGPKDYVLLRQIGMDLENAVDFGFFGPITKALFFALRYFYDFTKNWGWAIVLLTILIKILFVPFMQKSFSSQKKLQQMQPELKKIQERYGKMKNDDPRKQNMNAEIMGLHKRYGVNPLGGCLPMLVQMPVLFAFYSLLSNAIELRQAPFALWLQDLSRPDPYWVTPLLMGGTMLIQQRMTPVSDPMQQRMLYIMPVMFTYISLNLQSGLVLYWLLSNVLGIAHQWYFMRQQKSAIPVPPTDREGNG